MCCIVFSLSHTYNIKVAMETNDNIRKYLPTLRPPDQNLKAEIKNKGRILVQLMIVIFMFIPYLLVALYKKIFPDKGKSLHTNVAVVTGAGRGLGRALALKLAREGCKVACVDINEVLVAETTSMISKNGYLATSYVTNVASPEEVTKLAANVAKDLGPVDLLINNAALIIGHDILDIDNDQIKAIVSVNFLSHFWMLRAFLPSMKERNSGHIVAISSISAVVGLGGCTSYTSCKWAISGLMESVREELRSNPKNNIQTTTVYPYFINTSKDYTSFWDITLPVLTIDEVVEPVIRGIKLNHASIAIPESLYYSALFAKLLPWSIRDLLSDTIKVRVTPPKRQEWSNFPAFKIMEDTMVK